MKTDAQSHRQGFQPDDDKQMYDAMGSNRSEGAKTIKGQLFRVKNGNYFVKVKDGKEVRLHTDKTTKMMGEIKKGDRIEPKVNEQNHALSIRSAQAARIAEMPKSRWRSDCCVSPSRAC
jgi:hypothetical protein